MARCSTASHRTCSTRRLRPARLAAYLANATHLLVVAIAGGEIVGQCAGVIHLHPDKAPELFIDEVGVTPAMRNQGIARRMMEELTAWGAEQGCEEAWLGTEPDNDAANALYVRFAEPGTDPDVLLGALATSVAV